MDRKVAVITGGSRGIGKETSLLFAKEGYTVYFNYLNSDKLAQEVVKSAKNFKGKIEKVKADITKEEEVISFFEEIGEDKIDVLVNNAGITQDSLLLTMSKDKWERVIDVNLNGVFYCTKVAAKKMLRNKKGAIINIGSVAGITGNKGQSNYSASKAGLIGFTKSIARELASRNIRANVVVPGIIETDIAKSLSNEQREKIVKNIPLERVGTPKEVANLIFFLAQDSASYITGEVININGGLHM